METRCYLSLRSNVLGTPHGTLWHKDRAILDLLKKNKTSVSKETKQHTQEEVSEEPDQRFYRCRACQNPVAQIGDELSVGDIPIETMQINPHGYVHEIFTVRTAFGVIVTGNPVPADSWFPGYMWRYCLCGKCTAHLGWSYQPYNGHTIVFFGLRNASIKTD